MQCARMLYIPSLQVITTNSGAKVYIGGYGLAKCEGGQEQEGRPSTLVQGRRRAAGLSAGAMQQGRSVICTLLIRSRLLPASHCPSSPLPLLPQPSLA